MQVSAEATSAGRVSVHEGIAVGRAAVVPPQRIAEDRLFHVLQRIIIIVVADSAAAAATATTAATCIIAAAVAYRLGELSGADCHLGTEERTVVGVEDELVEHVGEEGRIIQRHAYVAGCRREMRQVLRLVLQHCNTHTYNEMSFFVINDIKLV